MTAGCALGLTLTASTDAAASTLPNASPRTHGTSRIIVAATSLASGVSATGSSGITTRRLDAATGTHFAPAPAAEAPAAAAVDVPPPEEADDATETPSEASADDDATEKPAESNAAADEAAAEGPEAPDGPAPSEPPAKKEPPRTPPRVDGIYLGVLPYAPVTFARVRVLDTPGAFIGGGGSARIGEAVFPWLTLGLDVGGSVAYHANQRVAQGALFVDAGFLPVPRIPFSIHVGFGVGGGAVRQQGVADRQGFGGAAFRGGLRYDVFPLVVKRQRKRGGGFAFGPELGWIGFTPAAKGRPMSNTIFLGLFVGYYFGS